LLISNVLLKQENVFETAVKAALENKKKNEMKLKKMLYIVKCSTVITFEPI